MTRKQPPLSIVKPAATDIEPPRKLGNHGMALWCRVQDEYRVTDSGGVELLCQACAMLDRAEMLAARIAEDGEMFTVKGVPRAHPCIREELGARAFVVRTLARLGLNVEAVKPVGRPGGGIGWRGD